MQVDADTIIDEIIRNTLPRRFKMSTLSVRNRARLTAFVTETKTAPEPTKKPVVAHNPKKKRRPSKPSRSSCGSRR